MRTGVAEAVRAGVKARGLTPAAVAGFLTAAAFTPLLVPLVGGMGGGEAAAALSQVGGIGGGDLAAVLSGVASRVQRSAGEENAAVTDERVRAELSEAVRRALEAPGDEGAGFRGEVSAVLRGMDAIQVAMAADRDNVLVPALAGLGERFTEFHWVLGDLGARLAEIQRTLVRQGVSQRSQILAARGELDTITGLLQRVIAAQQPPPPTGGRPAGPAGTSGGRAR